jgi:hypothetical protein
MALPQVPPPQQPDLQVHPQDQSIGTVPIAPPQLWARARAKAPWLVLMAVLLAVAAAIYWATLPDEEKIETGRTGPEVRS